MPTSSGGARGVVVDGTEVIVVGTAEATPEVIVVGTAEATPEVTLDRCEIALPRSVRTNRGAPLRPVGNHSVPLFVRAVNSLEYHSGCGAN